MTKTLAAFLAAAILPCAVFAQARPAPGVVAAPATPKWQGYDEAADAKADIARAIERARAEGKKVMVVFGANWCPDCRVLDQQIKDGRLKALVDRQLVMVKVDVGRFKKNLDLAEAYGVPFKKGIPTMVALDANGRAVYATLDGEMGDACDMGEAGLYKFFDRPW